MEPYFLSLHKTHLYMTLRKFALACTMLITLGAIASNKSFENNFADSTLRLDYTLSGNVKQPTIALNAALKFDGWAGRKSHMSELQLPGNGQLTAVDAATGDTIYRTSFSTLFQEWLDTSEAERASRAFEHVGLMPLPRRDTRIILTLCDHRQKVIAEHEYMFSPKDILVAQLVKAPFPNKVLHKAKNADNAIDIAILAEGYTREEMDSFLVHAQRTVDEILSYEPFKRYADDINFVAVESESVHSGVSVPRLGQWKHTIFGSHFSTFYSNRYLTTPNLRAVHDALAGVPYEHIIILANTDEYGGGGIYNNYLLTTTRHENFRPVVVHEFGHSFAGLADEYFYPGEENTDSYPLDVEPWEQNITTLKNFDTKWADMLKKGTPVPTPVERKNKYPVGVFEGGGYSAKGIYRPADECRMRNNSYPTFCPVCERAIERVIVNSLR